MESPRYVSGDSYGKRNAGSWDGAVGALAEAQHGVVARTQLGELGLTADEIEYRIRVGRLHLVHRGVYSVGHRLLSGDGRFMAAVLAGGPGAVLSHRSAADLWGIRPSASGYIDVTVPRQRRGRAGLRFHRTELPEDETTTERGIPVTTPARTLLDLAATLDRHRLKRAIEQAEVLRLGTGPSLDEVVRRHATRKGVPNLNTILEEGRIGEAITRSELEERFLAFFDEYGLPRPETNQTVAGLEVDCLWRDAGLIVELDGLAYHSTKDAFERDRERDRVLQANGWRVIRITWRQLHLHPAAVRRDLEAVLTER